MSAKSVAALLAAQPEEDLIEMRDSLRVEIARLQVEAQLVEQALSRRPRRRIAHGVEAGNGRLSGVKREDVLEVVRAHGLPVMPAEVRVLLAERGIELSGAATRNHLRRLVRTGKLANPQEGYYEMPAFKIEPQPIPVKDDAETRSWEPSS